MHFKIDWASLIAGSKFTVFALFYFVFEGNFCVTGLGGLYLEELIHGGAYYRNFTICYPSCKFGYYTITEAITRAPCG